MWSPTSLKVVFCVVYVIKQHKETIKNIIQYKFILSIYVWLLWSTAIISKDENIFAKNMLKTGYITPETIAPIMPTTNIGVFYYEYEKMRLKIALSYFSTNYFCALFYFYYLVIVKTF